MPGTIQYRGYSIHTDALWGFTYCHDDYDGPEDGRCGTGDSFRDCVNAIDDYIADLLFCKSCNHTGKINTEFAYDTCEHCENARKSLGDSVNFPDDPNLNADQSRHRWDTD
jgi:hypothetical protein